MAKSQWSKLDYFLPMSLVKEENALVDIKGGKVATNTGATKVFEGFDFDGSSAWIDTNFNPTTHNGNYKALDCAALAFVKEVIQPITVSTPALFSCDSGISNSSARELFSTRSSDQIGIYMVNTMSYRNANIHTSTWANSLVGMQRTAINKAQSLQNGVIKDTAPQTDTVLGNANFHIARINTMYLDVTTSLFSAGAAIGVNQVAKNDIYRQWLLDLGLNLSPDVNKLAGGSLTDTLAGDTITDELKGE